VVEAITELLASAARFLPEAVLLIEVRLSMPSVIFANESFEQLTGYSMHEIAGRDLTFLQGPETDMSVFQKLIQTTGGEGTVPCELLLYKKNGTPFWDQVATRKLQHEKDVYWVLVHSDITRRKEIENQFVLSQKREAVSHLVGGIIHDFNNLLTAIMVYSGLLTSKVQNDGQLQRYVEEIMASAERGAQLVTQLLNLERPDPAEPQIVAPGELVEEMRDLLRRMLGEAISLTIRSGADREKIKIHPGRLQQVLLNLGINSRDAMPQGGKLTISLSDLQLDSVNAAAFPDVPPARYVLITVTDTGTGMDAKIREQIFKPFFTTKEKGKGTGLGLFTVQTIIKQAGGHVYVESEPGKGTTFAILLPAVTDPKKIESKKTTLLLVEDEELVRRSVDATLALRGYRVLPAANADEATRISQNYSGEIHLMVTDLMMPGASGVELAQRIQEVRPDMKVLFMSGYSNDHRIQELGVGRENFFKKPFSPAALVGKIEEILKFPHE
jgi:two-component system cell cycle sensor histidine kinase/response regulator CckA